MQKPTPHVTAYDQDIIVAGGGIVGMTAAVALADAGFEVALIDRMPLQDMTLPAFDGRVTSVAYGSHVLLAALNVWRGLAKHAEPILDIRVADGGHPAFLHFDHRDLATAAMQEGKQAGRPFGYMVENRHLRQVLLRRLHATENVRLIAPAEVAGYTPSATGVSVALADCRQLSAQLLVAADGKDSPLRRQAGIRTIGWPYRQKAMVATFQHSKPHYGVAKEHFMASGPFALLPMTQQRSSLVWTERRDRVAAYTGLSDEEFAKAVEARAVGHLGTMKLAGPRFVYPLGLTNAEHYTAQRLVLIGDAAHSMHPLAGQGLNLAWRDAAVLAETLTDTARLGLDIGSRQVLAQYGQRRHWDAFTMLLMTDGLNKVFSTEFAPVRMGRRLGMGLVTRMPRARRYFERRASALAGDIPRLMQE